MTYAVRDHERRVHVTCVRVCLSVRGCLDPVPVLGLLVEQDIEDDLVRELAQQGHLPDMARAAQAEDEARARKDGAKQQQLPPPPLPPPQQQQGQQGQQQQAAVPTTAVPAHRLRRDVREQLGSRLADGTLAPLDRQELGATPLRGGEARLEYEYGREAGEGSYAWSTEYGREAGEGSSGRQAGGSGK